MIPKGDIVIREIGEKHDDINALMKLYLNNAESTSDMNWKLMIHFVARKYGKRITILLMIAIYFTLYISYAIISQKLATDNKAASDRNPFKDLFTILPIFIFIMGYLLPSLMRMRSQKILEKDCQAEFKNLKETYGGDGCTFLVAKHQLSSGKEELLGFVGISKYETNPCLGDTCKDDHENKHKPSGSHNHSHKHGDVKINGAEIKRLVVLPKYRQQKIGTMLLDEALDFVNKKKYDFVFATTRPANDAGLNLLKNNKFRVIDRVVSDNVFGSYFVQLVKKVRS